jgi:hypothetical protein
MPPNRERMTYQQKSDYADFLSTSLTVAAARPKRPSPQPA